MSIICCIYFLRVFSFSFSVCWVKKVTHLWHLLVKYFSPFGFLPLGILFYRFWGVISVHRDPPGPHGVGVWLKRSISSGVLGTTLRVSTHSVGREILECKTSLSFSVLVGIGTCLVRFTYKRASKHVVAPLDGRGGSVNSFSGDLNPFKIESLGFRLYCKHCI